MKVALIVIGKTKASYLIEMENDYLTRLKNYCNLEYIVVDEPKNSSKLHLEKLKQEETKKVNRNISAGDFVVLLDEKGKNHTSESFSKFIEFQSINTSKRLVFIVGGAFGFHSTLYERANAKIRLSSMTFTHQMIRGFFLEQLYRAYNIINNSKYHNS